PTHRRGRVDETNVARCGHTYHPLPRGREWNSEQCIGKSAGHGERRVSRFVVQKDHRPDGGGSTDESTAQGIAADERYSCRGAQRLDVPGKCRRLLHRGESTLVEARWRDECPQQDDAASRLVWRENVRRVERVATVHERDARELMR